MYSLLKNLVNAASQLPAGWFALPLRLIVGFGFMQHGYAKVAHGGDSFVHILGQLGVPMSFCLGWATIVFELLCGLAILAGFLVPLASVPMIIILLVAIFTVHLPNGFSSIKLLSVDAMGAHFGQPGYEADLLYLAAIVALMIGGAGPFSIDRRLFGDISSRRAAPNL
jgi:putative oxidoreductase